MSQNTLWKEISFLLVFGILLATGGGLSRLWQRPSSDILLFTATTGMLLVPLVWLSLAELLPRLARFLPALATWPRVFLWISLIHVLLLLPVAPLLGASLVRTHRSTDYRGSFLIALGLGTLLSAPWLRAGLNGPLDTLQLFPATAILVLVLCALRPPRRPACTTTALGLALLSLWPHSPLTQSLQNRFGTLLAIADDANGIAMVTDDANRGRLLRGPDGRAHYAQGMQQSDRFLAHLPLVVHGEPRHVLFLGRGSGHSVAAAGEHENLAISVRDRPDEPASLSIWLAGPPSAEAISLPADEACEPVTGGPFDVIVLQPPPVTAEAFSRCVSIAFLSSVSDALSENGIYAMKIDPGTLPVAELGLLVTHLSQAFVDLTLWAGQPASRWIALASKQPQKLSLARLKPFWENPRTGSSLRAAGRPTPFHFLAEFLMPRSTALEFGESFAKPGADVTRLPARSAQHRNSNFGFSAATSDDWTVTLLGGDAMVREAFRQIFAQMERSEAWRQNVSAVLAPSPEAALSPEEIDQIVTGLRTAGAKAK